MKNNIRIETRSFFKDSKLAYTDIHRDDIDALLELLSSVVKCSVVSKYVSVDNKTEYLQYAYIKDANDEDLLCFELCGFICICPNQQDKVVDKVCSILKDWFICLLNKKKGVAVKHEEERSSTTDTRKVRKRKERVQVCGKRLGGRREGRKPKSS